MTSPSASSTPPQPPAHTGSGGSASRTQKVGLLEWTAIAISVFALGISGFGLYYNHIAIDQARASYEQAAKRFEQSGPQLEISEVKIAIWNQKSSRWGDSIPRGKVLTYEELTEPNKPHLIFTVVNTGRATASIKEVGIKTSSDQSVVANGSTCPGKTEVLVECRFPLELQPTRTQRIYFSLDRVAQDALTCNAYIRDNGLEVLAIPTNEDEDLASGRSDISVAWASFCESIKPRGPR